MKKVFGIQRVLFMHILDNTNNIVIYFECGSFLVSCIDNKEGRNIFPFIINS